MIGTHAELCLPTRYNRDVYPLSTTLLRIAGAAITARGESGEPCVTEGSEGLPFDRVRDSYTEVGFHRDGVYAVLVRTTGKDRAASNIAAAVALATLVDPEFSYEVTIE